MLISIAYSVATMETVSSTDGYREYQTEAHRIISDVIESALKTYETVREAVQEEKTAAAEVQPPDNGQEEALERPLENIESVDGIPNIRWPPSRDFVMETGLKAIEKFIKVIISYINCKSYTAFWENFGIVQIY